MMGLRLLGGTMAVLLTWVTAAWALQDFELEVRVLRPWQRLAYGCLAFAAGLSVAWWLVAEGGW